MSAGLPGDEDPSWPVLAGGDWVSSILARGTDQPPGDGFAYSSVSSHLLAAILVETTGRSVLAYARVKLFGPLGIETRPAFQPRLIPGRPEPIRAYERAAFAWPRDPQGIHIGFGSLKLTAPDMLKVGTLFLHEGEWRGEQLVPAAWVRQAVSPAVPTGGEGPGSHYGFQWWVTTAGGHSAFAAIGFGGQIIEVVPDLNLVVVASTWIDEDLRFDADTWELMVTHASVPEFEPD
jgi:CubicO group peptidase (beta-lactamase class C family)